jgi:glycosyltransferase involved in cell wall biosynthesis
MIEFINAWSVNFPNDDLIVVTTKGERINQITNIRFVCLPRIPHPFFNLIFLSLTARFLNSDAVVAHNFPAIHQKSGVFIHDFIFVDHPEWFTKLERIYFGLMKPLNRFFAKFVFTSSKTEARRLKKNLELPVLVCPLGLRSSLADSNPVAPLSMKETSESFYLAVGRNNPRKNIDLLIQAYLSASSNYVLPKLVVVSNLESQELSNTLPLHNMNRVVFIPEVNDDELAWLYQNTSLFVFPSLDEGFGMPIIEALYFKSNMLLSDICVFHEVSRENAIFVNPNSIIEMSNALIKNHHEGSKYTPSTHYTTLFEWSGAVSQMRKTLNDLR